MFAKNFTPDDWKAYTWDPGLRSAWLITTAAQAVSKAGAWGAGLPTSASSGRWGGGVSGHLRFRDA